MLIAESPASAMEHQHALAVTEQFVHSLCPLIQDKRADRDLKFEIFAVLPVTALAHPVATAPCREEIAVPVRPETTYIRHRPEVHVSPLPSVTSGGAHKFLPFFMQPGDDTVSAVPRFYM